MRLRALGPCSNRELEQFAVVTYAARTVNNAALAVPRTPFPLYSNTFNRKAYMNHPNTTCGLPDSSDYCISDLSSYVLRPDIVEGKSDYKFYLGYGFMRQNVFERDNHVPFWSE